MIMRGHRVLPFSKVATDWAPAPAASSLNLMTMIKLVMRQKRRNNDPEIKHSDLPPSGVRSAALFYDICS